ncbi:MAG TPA: SUMF1/EgtB/PvdO family nonheme iron enzyme [Thermoanaerobaculia bacterium]
MSEPFSAAEHLPAAAGDPSPVTVVVPAGLLRIPHTVADLSIGPFRLGRTPVTNREYVPFLESGRAEAPPWWGHLHFSRPRQPVVGVTWDDAAAYCEWLTERTGSRWRLPTEAEWEFAMCGGLRAPATAWGDRVPAAEIPPHRLDGPWDVGRGSPNGYGLCDPGTIVHEWCANWSDPDESRPGPRRRASRGGSWRHQIRWSPPSARTSLPPEYRYSDYGFRVLQEVDENG